LAGKEVLEDALEQYPGAMLIVTHDRSLMARVATQVLEVHEGRVILHPGGYDDYEHTRLARLAAAGEADGAPRQMAGHADPAGRAAKAATPAPAGSPKEKPAGLDPADRRRGRAERQKREKEQKRIEGDIEAREARVRELGALLADPEVYQDGARSKALVTEYERVRAEVESLWERLAALSEAE
jgi:ATP-binding cassette subfamily F protein 3